MKVIEWAYILIILLPLAFFNANSDKYWFLGNSILLWILALLIRHLSAKEGRIRVYCVILTTLALINVIDEFIGFPEKHEPSEYIMGIGVIVYEIIKYLRYKKIRNAEV